MCTLADDRRVGLASNPSHEARLPSVQVQQQGLERELQRFARCPYYITITLHFHV
jgi:hypothetical protein